MTNKAFDKIMDGLADALAYAEGDDRRGKAHTVVVPAGLDAILQLRNTHRLHRDRRQPYGGRLGSGVSAGAQGEQQSSDPGQEGPVSYAMHVQPHDV